MSNREYTERDFAKALMFCDAMGKGNASVVIRPAISGTLQGHQFSLRRVALLDFGGSMAAMLDLVLEAAE